MPDAPRFIINATNLQSGALWRFMKPYMRDYKVGEVKNPRTSLATAVAASAFSPFLSPVQLEIDEAAYTRQPKPELVHRPPFTTPPLLTDGGVYDNLGLETVWKRCRTVFVSDGGARMQPHGKQERDWLRQGLRANTIIDNQVRALRKRQVVDSYKTGLRHGTYWGIGTDIEDYKPASHLPCPFNKSQEIAAIDTRLGKMDRRTQERQVNWGYAVCDAALRSYFDPALPAGNFPYRNGIE